MPDPNFQTSLEVSAELFVNLIKSAYKGVTGFVAEEIRVGRKELALQTLYKQKIRRQ